MNTVDYTAKKNATLSDISKFMKIEKTSNNDLKQYPNKHITCVNALISSTKLSKLVDYYEPAYIYANPKINKQLIDPPIRAIVSQICIPTSQVDEKITDIILKYMPRKYIVECTSEFVFN